MSKKEGFTLVTYVLRNEQERAVRALIKSIREFGGDFRDSRIFVALGDPLNAPCAALKGEKVQLLPLEMEKRFMEYPLAVKAFAAALVEERVSKETETLAWVDPGVIVVGSLEALNLEGAFDAAMRPVTLSNGLSLLPGSEPDGYWEPIFRAARIDHHNLPTLETIVDEVQMLPYYNCEVFSINPRLGICAAWAQRLKNLLQDEGYQREVCSTFLRRLFLHQAVLTGVMLSMVPMKRVKSLPITGGYPFQQHARMPQARQISSLNQASAVIFDEAWSEDPAWMSRMRIDEPLKGWLFEAYLDYLKLNDHLYRMEGSCNSYLVTTEEGSVLIDPAGAAAAPEYFRKVMQRHPLKAILLTHAHKDHWAGIDDWRAEVNVPVIAHREFIPYNEYCERLLPFYARRAAIWERKPLPKDSEVEPLNAVVPTITFTDEHTLELGGFHFKMIHTSGETPDQAVIWVPELGAFFVGDDYFAYFINNATLRGTLTRPVRGYIRALDLALAYGAEFFLPGHGAPVVGKALVASTVKDFRDVLQYICDETIKGINEGKGVHQLMQEIRVRDRYRILPYFGKVEWTVRGIYHENIGWFDENPALMYALPPSSVYGELVDLIGAEALLGRAERLMAQKEYVKVLHLIDVLLQADPCHRQAHEVRISALEGLREGCRNFIERIWLDYGIRTSREKINNKSGFT